MKLVAVVIQNYRLLRNQCLSLEGEKATLLVGPNNSGKTSVAEALRTFLAADAKSLAIDDFSVGVLTEFKAFGGAAVDGIEPLPALPSMVLELRMSYEDVVEDLQVADHLLMDLDEATAEVVMRIEYGPTDPAKLAAEFKTQHEAFPEVSVFEFLRSRLQVAYRFRYFKVSVDGKSAEALAPDKVGGLMRELIKVDFLPAQRHMEDHEVTSQATKLSRLLNSHYEKRYRQVAPEGYAELEVVVRKQAGELTIKYGEAFAELKQSLLLFGYPDTPDLTIKAELSAAGIFKDNTRVYYTAAAEPVVEGEAQIPYELPEKYNGLGFKNLIFMVLQLKAFRDAVAAPDVVRPRIHLVVVEEPEAHLHPQMQTVFLQKAQAFLGIGGADGAQLVITTHSSHLTAASGLTPVRYFRRKGSEAVVKDLVTFKGSEEKQGRKDAYDFISRYLTLTRCDLFFADKAILIEGAVERLLLPSMVGLAVQDGHDLTQTYLSIIEVGGAYAHIFKEFLAFLAIPTLIVTDLDATKDKKKCRVAEGVASSNATLKSWLPCKQPLAEIRAATADQRRDGLVYLVFQQPEAENGPCGRSFEEAFCYANAHWLIDNRAKLAGTAELFEDFADASTLNGGAYDIDFPKVDFAIDLLLNPGWKTPLYIRDGLAWLAATN